MNQEIGWKNRFQPEATKNREAGAPSIPKSLQGAIAAFAIVTVGAVYCQAHAWVADAAAISVAFRSCGAARR